MVFLVVAFVKKRARLLQSLVFFSSFSSRQTQSDEIFVQFVQLNEYLGNASKLSQRVPTFSFHFFKRNIQNRTILKGPGCYEFGLLLNFFDIARLLFRTFLSPKVSPSILLKSPLVTSGVKRYIRTFDVISELLCVLVRRVRRFENRRFS